MHHLLCIEEILLEIFDRCYDCDNGHTQGKNDLVSLARTCKTFKEPALDVLWAELSDLTPLVRCLPEASFVRAGKYALRRPLGEADWDVILGYTCRVRASHACGLCGLTAECIEKLSNPPSSITTIFPKFSRLTLEDLCREIVPFLRHFAVPNFTVLKIRNPLSFRIAIDAFGDKYPNITTFNYTCENVAPTSKRILDLIYRWPKLRSVDCRDIAFNAAALIHLSNLPDLKSLRTTLDDAVVISFSSAPSMLTFRELVDFELCVRRSVGVDSWLNHLRFPSIQTLRFLQLASLEPNPLLSTLANICNHTSLTDIFLCTHPSGTAFLPYSIGFQDLRLLTVFSNIRILVLSPYSLDLSEQELLQLASSWPNLQQFVIEGFPWKESSAITPGGFVQLLQRCRSLSVFSFQFDTRGYTEVPQGHPWHGLRMPKNTIVNVLGSTIEEESVEALAVFFRVGPFPEFELKSNFRNRRSTNDEELPEPLKSYHGRWSRVFSLARKLWEKKRNLFAGVSGVEVA